MHPRATVLQQLGTLRQHIGLYVLAVGNLSVLSEYYCRLLMLAASARHCEAQVDAPQHAHRIGEGDAILHGQHRKVQQGDLQSDPLRTSSANAGLASICEGHAPSARP